MRIYGSTIAAREENYLHPAPLSLRAYILPISPRPIMPMVKPSVTILFAPAGSARFAEFFAAIGSNVLFADSSHMIL